MYNKKQISWNLVAKQIGFSGFLFVIIFFLLPVSFVSAYTTHDTAFTVTDQGGGTFRVVISGVGGYANYGTGSQTIGESTMSSDDGGTPPATGLDETGFMTYIDTYWSGSSQVVGRTNSGTYNSGAGTLTIDITAVAGRSYYLLVGDCLTGALSGGYCSYANLNNVWVASIHFDGGGAYIPPVTDFTTRFISFTPTLGTTTPVATSTTFAFGVTGYINSSDLSSTTEVYMRWRQQSGMGLRGNSAIGQYGDFTFPISSSGAFSLSTTTSVTASGVYGVYWELRNCSISLFGFCLYHSTLKNAIGNFVVAEATSQEIQSVQILTNTTGGGQVDQVIPTEETASSTVLGLGSAFGLTGIVLSKFPINWVVQYADVLTNLASSTTSTTSPSAVINYSSLRTLQNIPTTTPQSLSFTFFSSTTIAQVASISGIQLARTFVGWTLWIGLIFYAWRRATALFSRPSGS